jgi:hypothetical protein
VPRALLLEAKYLEPKLPGESNEQFLLRLEELGYRVAGICGNEVLLALRAPDHNEEKLFAGEG